VRLSSTHEESYEIDDDRTDDTRDDSGIAKRIKHTAREVLTVGHADLPKVGAGASDDDDAEEEAEPTTIEYLDHRVVIERGWDIDDPELFEKAAAADLDKSEYGVIEGKQDQTILQIAEEHDFQWPFQCRSGTCARCAGVLRGGEAEMDMNLFLEDEEVEEEGYRLTCTCYPESEEVQIVFNSIRSKYVRTIAQNRG
jgi:ferredoxin